MVAELCYLSRNVAIIFRLAAHKVLFEVAKLDPEAEPLMPHIDGAFGKRERALITTASAPPGSK